MFLTRLRFGARAQGNGSFARMALSLCLCGASGLLPAVAAGPPPPALRLPLSDFGFPGYVNSLLRQGASMTTLHMLDSTHLLLTYSLRSLVKRLPGDDANDSDREVAAVLVLLPEGKVLARAKWRLHDHGRYLWNVGHGRFVLRSGESLSLLAPLQALAAGRDPLLRTALPHRPGLPALIEGSPDGRMITVEVAADKDAAHDDGGDAQHKPRHFVLEFLRVQEGDQPTESTSVSIAGVVGAPGLLHLAMDGDGYLWPEDARRGRWTISFNEFGGKQQTLAPVMSSCRPRLNLLSRNEFLVETCRGSDQAPMLASYGFDGHENWQESFGENLQPPTLSIAPAAGRFALSRLAAYSGGSGVSGVGSDETMSQEIRVYQTESGDMLLRVPCAPVVRSAENFDLSPDGRTLAVLAPETLDLYHLPDLTAQDRKDLAEAETMTPPTGSGPVLLSRITHPVGAPPETPDANEGADAAPAPSPSGAAAAPVSAQASRPAGQSPVTPAASSAGADGAAGATPRKPPTLLNPGERPESKTQNNSPR